MFGQKFGRWHMMGVAVLTISVLTGCQAQTKQTAAGTKPVVEGLAVKGAAAQNNVENADKDTSSSAAKSVDSAKVNVEAKTKALDMPKPTDAAGQYSLALKILQADGDQGDALKWLEQAALQGHGDAAYRLGQMQTKASRQVEWYSLAATVGQVDAQYALGDSYLNGQGTAKEPAWGLSWLERAARAGHPQAQFAMGVAMATGLSGSPQRAEGLVWLLIARKNGILAADSVISVLKARLSKSLIKLAQDRADTWTNEPSGDAKNRAVVRFAQYALGRLGFDAGLPDGISGDRTNRAIQDFRQKQGLGDGGLDFHLLDVLRERLAALNH